MIEYVCDGSERRGVFGAGVVRIANEVDTYTYMARNGEVRRHLFEQYAVLKTLEIVERFGDKQATIYNDNIGLIETFASFQDKFTKVSEKKKQNITLFLPLFLRLKKKGYIITIRHTSEFQRKQFHQLAHGLSRTYINLIEEEKINLDAIDVFKSEPFEPRNEKTEKLLSSRLEDKENYTQNKHLLKKYFSEVKPSRNVFYVRDEVFREMDTFIFVKITGSLWGVFSETEELIYAGRNIYNVAIGVFEKIPNGKPIYVNGQFYRSLRPFRKYNSVQPKVKEVKRLLETKNINIVADFLFQKKEKWTIADKRSHLAI